jgi:hypothetical protein
MELNSHCHIVPSSIGGASERTSRFAHRQVVNEVKQAYALLFIARKATEVHLTSVELLRQIADASQTKYATGRITQQEVPKPVVELSKLHGDLLMFKEQPGIAAARLSVLLARAPEAPIGPLTKPALTAQVDVTRQRPAQEWIISNDVGSVCGVVGIRWLLEDDTPTANKHATEREDCRNKSQERPHCLCKPVKPAKV